MDAMAALVFDSGQDTAGVAATFPAHATAIRVAR